jgi:hypothetical protein
MPRPPLHANQIRHRAKGNMGITSFMQLQRMKANCYFMFFLLYSGSLD